MSVKVRKPKAEDAMRSLIESARDSIPFGISEAEMCSGGCRGCSKKLLNFLEFELDDWEQRLGSGERPSFGELNALAKTCKKIHAALSKSGLV